MSLKTHDYVEKSETKPPYTWNKEFRFLLSLLKPSIFLALVVQSWAHFDQIFIIAQKTDMHKGFFYKSGIKIHFLFEYLAEQCFTITMYLPIQYCILYYIRVPATAGQKQLMYRY